MKIENNFRVDLVNEENYKTRVKLINTYMKQKKYQSKRKKSKEKCK